jgi:PHD/YefM family antitoxin component YafN of YafNO toxin-antitoxin module
VKSIEQSQAQEHFDQILDDVQRPPIVIRREGRNVAIVLSMIDYERLRVGAIREFLDLRNDIAREAKAAGLTEERLSELLNDD